MLQELEEPAPIPGTQQPNSPAASAKRRMLFLSHATPEDNAFVRWLATQLAIAGYQVWCDLTELLGGERFWSDIEEAIDSATFRFLFVSTLHANTKAGTLRELRLAQQAQEKHNIKDFIIPIKIDAFPFESMQESIRDLNIMRFDSNWAAGLSKLIALLEREGMPKSASANAACVMDWYGRSIDQRRQVVISNDKYISNWFRIQPPPRLHLHRFTGPQSDLEARASAYAHPHRVHGSYLVTFAPSHEVTDALGPGWDSDHSVNVPTQAFLDEGLERPQIAQFDAVNIVSDLVRQAWESEVKRQGLCLFKLASGLCAWFFKNLHLDKNKAHYTAIGGRRTYRQLVGLKSKRLADGTKVSDGYWHYAVSASIQLQPFPRLVLRHHVIFTDDGERPWENAERMHKARRSVCKNWWNKEWRDRLLAICAQLGDGKAELTLPTGGEEMRVAMVPMRFTSPWTYFEDGALGLDEAAEIELTEDNDGGGCDDDDEAV